MPFAEICEPISHIGEGIVCGNGFHSLFEKFSEQTGNTELVSLSNTEGKGLGNVRVS